jgi:hypothetical protein
MLATFRYSRYLRRIVAVAMMFAYGAIVGGVPLPAGKKALSKGGELYPCSASSCGCDSAERCWSSCCCHTMAQRLEWAKEHGVRPPEFALAEARSSGHDTSPWDGAKKTVIAVAVTGKKPCCCCAKKVAAAPSCCEKKVAAAASSCCSKKVAAGCCSSKKSESDNARDNTVIGWRALACHGQSLNWLAAVPALITLEYEFADEAPLVAWLGPHSSESAAGVTDVPTPPPPERA